MNIIHYLLDFYFAAALGIAGIAKFDDPSSFEAVLAENKFPRWSIVSIKNMFPWVEILVALCLQITSNTSKLFVSGVVFLLFLFFFFINISSYMRHNSGKNCGCYGKAMQGEVASAKILSSGLQLLLSSGLVAMSIWAKPLPGIFYLGSSAIFIVGFLWLLGRTWQRKIVFSRIARGSFLKEG
jgi:uncharacterized membrane protein